MGIYLFSLALGILIFLNGCSILDRSDRLRFMEVKGDKEYIGINITDATKRLAVIYPNGRFCSELSPPAILEIDKAFKAGFKAAKTSVGSVGTDIDTKKKVTAVKLTEATEKIECLRISLFHACALAASHNMKPEQEIDLYKTAIQTCYGEN